MYINMQVPVKKTDFILVVFMAFLALLNAGFIFPATNFNNVLAYTCVHSIGVMFIASEFQPCSNRNLKRALLILTSAIILYKLTSLQMNGSEQLCCLFCSSFLLRNGGS
jgi:hypothetical protein